MNKANCIIVDDEMAAREILESYVSQTTPLNYCGNCKNAIEAFAILNKMPIDLIFLDINMPEISGLAFAKSINKNIKIIFTTAHREHALDGFDLQAVDYLLKPISFERFLKAVNKFLGENSISNFSNLKEIEIEKNDFLFVRADRKMVKIDFSDILYIESLSDYIKINTSKKTIITRETISNIEAKLPVDLFIRIHRSYIISLNNIESFTSEFIEINKTALPISRSYKKSVLEILEKF
ncbi:LytR/AlgR family response regulator transcription factor [Flavobacterium okayamense]|uniref:DNA-binding response regulator n=1 Tax=Flavobacterium okayamense TaxID=2830782 RepID=A0ABN6HRZ6_9FLAO|nr:LytTR family DNA-binding domain-containing protein [Flavobacterium okayamense]BCY27360.1 DNA-binding response regulator [Flavobacterium okayamense]